MPAWLIITFIGSVFQTVRNSFQKQLRNTLSVNMTNWVRYAFGLPFLLMYLLFLQIMENTNTIFIPLDRIFLLFSLGNAIFQILATSCLIHLFGTRNFAIGMTYAKTETIQSFLLGFILFQESISFMGILAMSIGLVGIIIISFIGEKVNIGTIYKACVSQSAMIGLATGFFFAIGGLCIRKASLSLEGPAHITAASTLLTSLLMQVCILGVVLLIKNRHSFMLLKKVWKQCVLTGFFSIGGSIAWFTAYTLINVAYIKTVAQVDIILSIFITHIVFKEKINKAEMLGMVLVISGIILLVVTSKIPS